MPYLANLHFVEEPSRQYLTDVYNSVVLNDVVKRNKIRDIDLLTRIVTYVIGNIGTTFAATSITKFLKNERRTVATDTVLNYIQYCVSAYLFYQVKRQDIQGKRILSSNEKYYMADHGYVKRFSAATCGISIWYSKILCIWNYFAVGMQ